MKILHVVPSYYPAFKFGGPIQSVHLLNKSLIELGIELSVFTTNAGLKEREDIIPNEWQLTEGVKVKYFSFIGYEHYNFSLNLFIALIKEVKNMDLVHITAVWNFPVLAACFACWVNKKPYIISPRGTIYPETIAIKSAQFKKIYYKLFAEKCLKKASAIHYTSIDEQKSVTVSLKLKNKSIVVPNGIDLSQFNNLSDLKPFDQFFPALKNRRYLLFLGRINKKKGLDILYEAMAKIKNEYHDVVLVVAGPDNDNYNKELDLLSSSLSIQDIIIYTGQLEGEQKLAAYHHAFAFILSSYSENFGMSVVEAMACDTPVIISDKVGIFTDIESKKAGIIVKTKPESIYEGIKKILDDEGLRQQLRSEGKLMASEFYDIRAVGKAFYNLYKETIIE